MGKKERRASKWLREVLEKAKRPKRLCRIDPKKVESALQSQVVIAAAHLDLEGVAYIKLTRTGPQECFGADVTSRTLKDAGFTIGEQEKHFWRKPAMEKYGTPL